MEVIVSDCKNNPSCPHGPCLLFERYCANGSKSGKKFFACSACRDRSDCSFFQWEDEEMSNKSKELWKQIINEGSPPFSHEEFSKRLEIFKSYPTNKRCFCRTCSLIILDDLKRHLNHDLVKGVENEILLHPSTLFGIRENKKVEAQYFFSESTVNFLVSLLKDLGFTKFVSIGTPRIHEYVQSQKVSGLSSFLMDIDFRYMQFFSPEEFCYYNMFNNHFFEGKESKKHFKNFLDEGENDRIVILLDPPFGGLIDAIAYSLKTINKWWQKINDKTNEQIPLLWMFPYFHEWRILKNLPDMKMMDYKVEYINHKKFGKHSSKNSPVRIFTNIEASKFVPPVENGYRYCKKCDKYVSEENKHCPKCDSCSTKHGKTYHHCDDCNQCVKSTYIHCQKCSKCGPVSANSVVCKNCKSNDSVDGLSNLEKCFKCHGVGHRKRYCPEGLIRPSKKRKFE